MTRRQGLWRSLSLDLHLSDGAAHVARVVSHGPLDKLIGALDKLEKGVGAKEEPALILIRQVREAIREARTQFIAEARNVARTTLWSPLHLDLRLWATCEAEWSKGPGFRMRVGEHLEKWFDSNQDRLDEFNHLLQEAWKERFVGPLRSLSR